jgi:hypothetical protein
VPLLARTLTSVHQQGLGELFLRHDCGELSQAMCRQHMVCRRCSHGGLSLCTGSSQRNSVLARCWAALSN